MKYLVIFLLLINTCFAQKILVKNEDGKALANVAVFLVERENSLIGVTNNEGFSEISLNQNANYLFHLIGFEDLKLPYSTINQKKEIVLKDVTNQLEDIVVAYSKYNVVLIKNKPTHTFWSDVNFLNTSLNKVVQIRVDSAGFLNKLAFVIKVQNKLNASDYRFVLFRDENGKPGVPLINEEVFGKINRNNLQFDLRELNFYIEKGNYFFGFEALTPTAANAKKIEKDEQLKVPLFALSTLDTAKSYVRYNLGEWKREISSKAEVEKNNIYPAKDKGLAYELEILTPLVK